MHPYTLYTYILTWGGYVHTRRMCMCICMCIHIQRYTSAGVSLVWLAFLCITFLPFFIFSTVNTQSTRNEHPSTVPSDEPFIGVRGQSLPCFFLYRFIARSAILATLRAIKETLWVGYGASRIALYCRAAVYPSFGN